jgi:hypothetical protein
MLIETNLKSKKIDFDSENYEFDFRWDYSPEEENLTADKNYNKFLRDNYFFDHDKHKYESARFSF